MVNITYGVQERLTLVAVETPQGRLAEGGDAPVALYLSAPRPVKNDYQLFIQLLDEAGREIANVTTHPGWGRSPTSLWQPGALYADNYWVHVQHSVGDRSPLLARVYVGFIDPATEERGRLPLPARTAHGELITPYVASVIIQPFSQPDAADYGLKPIGSQFGGVIALVGANDPEGVALAAGESMTVTLLWEAIGAPAADYTAFVHLLDSNGNQAAGFDQEPAPGRFPTRHWRSGDRILSEFVLTLPPSLAAGPYQLWVGLYESASQGQIRLPITDAAGQVVAHDMVLLGAME
jgi:hypothetical protein